MWISNWWTNKKRPQELLRSVFLSQQTYLIWFANYSHLLPLSWWRRNGITNISLIRHIKWTKFKGKMRRIKEKKNLRSVMKMITSNVYVCFSSSVRFCTHFNFQHFKRFSTKIVRQSVVQYNLLNEHLKCVHNGKEHPKRWKIFLYFLQTGKYVWVCFMPMPYKFPNIQREIKAQRSERGKKTEHTTSHSPLRRLLVMAFNFQLE